MRQVRDNPKLETLNLGVDYTDPKNKCTIKVKSCGEQPKSGVTCHRFYKCIDGKAYSCQNPKWLHSTCSGKYWGKGGKGAYTCPDKTPGDLDTCRKKDE